MSKITDYPLVNSPDSGDVLLIDGTNGTRILPIEKAGIGLDPTFTQTGKAADAKETGDKLGALKSDISKNYVPYSTGVNLLNAYDTDITLNKKYVIYNTGRVSSNNDFMSFLIPIVGGNYITCRGCTNAHLSFYTEDTPDFNTLASGTILNGFISGINPSSNPIGYEVPATAKYMCISVPNTRQGSVQIAYGTESIPYEPYEKGIHYSLILDPPEIEHKEVVEYNIYVDGTGDFANLKECLSSIPAETSADFDENKFYIINLYPGVHDMIAMYGGESALSANGMFLRPNTKIRGIGDKHNVVISGERTTTSNTWSLFNIRNYADLENLTLKSKNARYTIHDDWQTAVNVKSYRHFKDVIFTGENCQYGSVYGSGLKGNSEWLFENCEFDATKAAANGTPGNAFSLHNNNNVTTASFVTFRNCRLLNGSESYKTFRLLSMTTGSANGTVYVTLEGNKVDGIDLRENDASQYGAGCSFWVNGFANVNTLGVSVSSTDGVDYSGRVDLI